MHTKLVARLVSISELTGSTPLHITNKHKQLDVIGVKSMKADVGSLLFIQDKIDAKKRRPYMCAHVFTNTAGVPYNWLVIPITSKDSVGKDNLVQVAHNKLGGKKKLSYVKLNNMEAICWSDEIEVASKKFAKKQLQCVRDRLGEIFKTKN